MRPILLAALAVTGLLGGTAEAAKVDMVVPFGNLLVLSPKTPGPGGPKPYTMTNPAARWSIAQWDIPGGALSPFVTQQHDDLVTILKSHSKEASVQIIRTLAGETLRLTQTGAPLSCLTPDGTPRESDLFASPNGGAKYGVGRPGLLLPGDKIPTLTQMTRLEQSFTLSVVQGLAPTHKGCAVNQGGALIALILQTPATHPIQTLFYQMTLSRICGPGTAARVRLCNAPPTHPSWFFVKNPFGVDDVLPLAGQPFLASGETRNVSLNLLPRLIDVVKNSPPGMDHNPADWKVTGVYIGQHIWGDVTLQSTWANYRLVAVTP
ncbi:MAG: hypothetical protein PHT60_14455 [Acidiphilium sp.]|nr:hypothetical protein [Acidiphilium sp.]MDD4936963.1 hypothetical protein [Acidiphilium sp.]